MKRAGDVVDATCTYRDYCSREHAGFYALPAKCWNCGHTANVEFSMGHAAHKVECPNCGCDELRPSLKATR